MTAMVLLHKTNLPYAQIPKVSKEIHAFHNTFSTDANFSEVREAFQRVETELRRIKKFAQETNTVVRMNGK